MFLKYTAVLASFSRRQFSLLSISVINICLILFYMCVCSIRMKRFNNRDRSGCDIWYRKERPDTFMLSTCVSLGANNNRITV